jgi:hypothetical protein
MELLQISIGKVDNGYTVNLLEPPKLPKVEATKSPSEMKEVNVDMDEKIDKMIDGFTAFLRHINDKGAGENWKEDNNREQLREGFKMAFPGLARGAYQTPGAPRHVLRARHENRVFETKEALIKYLEENL